MPPTPRIAIVGSGAVGCYFGAKLALCGADVRFLMRADLAAVRARGSLVIRGEGPDRVLSPVQAYASSQEIGPVDLVVVALKAAAAPQVPQLVQPLLGPDTAILTLQNGLGPDEYLASVFGPGRVLGGLAIVAAVRTGPGELQCFHPGSLVMGEFIGPESPRLRRVAGLFEAAKVPVRRVDDLAEARWAKLVWNIPFNGLAIAAGGVTTDKICADPELAAQARALMHEVQAAAAALGHRIGDDFIERQFAITAPIGPYKPSSLVDYLGGREVEVEAIWGEPLCRARAAGVAVPRLEALYARIQALCAPQRPA